MNVHVDGCDACAREVALERRLRDGIRRLPASGAPLALTDRLVSIGDAGQTVWLAGADTVGTLPSRRRRRRRATQATLGSMGLVLAMVAAVGWLLGSGLPGVDGITGVGAAAAHEAGAAAVTGTSASATGDPLVAALRRVPGASPTGGLRAVAVGSTRQQLSADVVRLLLGTWPSGRRAATLCSASSGCVGAVVRAGGESVAVTLLGADARPLETVAWTPLAGISDADRFSYAGAATLAGRAVVGVEATTPAGAVLRRWWLATDDLQLARVDSYAGGVLAATETFRDDDATASTSCPEAFACPATVAGLALASVAVDSRTRPQQVALLYADDRRTVVVVEQRGRLTSGAGEVSVAGRVVSTWQSDSTVFAVTATSSQLVEPAARALPHQPPASTSGLRRIVLGWERLGGR